MHIRSIQLTSYGPFADSGPIRLEPGIKLIDLAVTGLHLA